MQLQFNADSKLPGNQHYFSAVYVAFREHSLTESVNEIVKLKLLVSFFFLTVALRFDAHRWL